MNFYKVLKRISCLLLAVGLFASCEKDEETNFTLTGDVKITFLNKAQLSTTFHPEIYVVGEYRSPLKGLQIDEKGVSTVEDLNYGNYMLVYYIPGADQANSYYKAFQIKAGEVTELTIQ
ncbi:hypothetical protein GXP67_05540 [Rhodocytophaga rosea]|uniref:Uncharacterized protein n=1 Tax=Rhodocytophaga rosea TaxID=2704465 RepID=A0A6C0GE03_9BACT|nr:hypothetical protein [Rhodocytophaga rosea]QHT66168.1 hypothetical protein GXP67_05540 [Rhodocytophaga rosea]